MDSSGVLGIRPPSLGLVPLVFSLFSTLVVARGDHIFKDSQQSVVHHHSALCKARKQRGSVTSAYTFVASFAFVAAVFLVVGDPAMHTLKGPSACVSWWAQTRRRARTGSEFRVRASLICKTGIVMYSVMARREQLLFGSLERGVQRRFKQLASVKSFQDQTRQSQPLCFITPHRSMFLDQLKNSEGPMYVAIQPVLSLSCDERDCASIYSPMSLDWGDHGFMTKRVPQTLSSICSVVSGSTVETYSSVCLRRPFK